MRRERLRLCVRLQEDQDKFEEFLKKNDKMAHQAIAKAEKETKVQQRPLQTHAHWRCVY